MTESELKEQIINRILDLKKFRTTYKLEKNKEPMIYVKTVIRILEEFLEVNPDEKTNRTNKAIN